MKSRGTEINLLQFVDDTLIVGQLTWDNIWAIKSILSTFEIASSLKVNYTKSKLVSINNNNGWNNQVENVLQCKMIGAPFQYWLAY